MTNKMIAIAIGIAIGIAITQIRYDSAPIAKRDKISSSPWPILTTNRPRIATYLNPPPPHQPSLNLVVFLLMGGLVLKRRFLKNTKEYDGAGIMGILNDNSIHAINVQNTLRLRMSRSQLLGGAPKKHDGPHPQCPYDDTTPIDTELECWYEGCTVRSSSWESAYLHVCRQHSCSAQILKTHGGKTFLDRANAEINKKKFEKAKGKKQTGEDYYSKKKAADGAPIARTSGYVKASLTQQRGAASGSDIASSASATAAASAPATATPTAAQTHHVKRKKIPTVWRQISMWVRCHEADGSPVLPYDVSGPVDLSNKPDTSSDECETPGDGAATSGPLKLRRARKASRPDTGVVGLSSLRTDDVVAHEASQNIVPRGSDGGDSGDPRWLLINRLSTIAEKVDNLVAHKDEQLRLEDWASELPTVGVKAKYIAVTPPPCKGEVCTDRKGNEVVCARATLPRVCDDRQQHQDFEVWLGGAMRKHGDNLTKAKLGAQRFLGMLTVEPHPTKPHINVCDVECMVSVLVSELHEYIINLPLMSPKYAWGWEIMMGLRMYLEFWRDRCRTAVLKNDKRVKRPWLEALDKFIKDIELKWKIALGEEKQRKHVQKQESDMLVLEKLNMGTLQKACWWEYCALVLIADHSLDLNARMRGIVNQLISALIAYDTFSGRKGEWEHMTLNSVTDSFNQKLGYFVCPKHKTSYLYGSAIKVYHEALDMGLKLYMNFSKPEGLPEGFKFLLVPSKMATATVSLPGALHNFNERFLTKIDPHHPFPTYNIMRKHFHNFLRSDLCNEKGLKRLMVLLDKHSEDVQDRNYILKTPKDHKILGDKLCSLVIGEEPLRFPTLEDANQLMASEPRFAELMVQIWSGEDDPVEASEAVNPLDNKDDELEPFENSEIIMQVKPKHEEQHSDLLPTSLSKPEVDTTALAICDVDWDKAKSLVASQFKSSKIASAPAAASAPAPSAAAESAAAASSQTASAPTAASAPPPSPASESGAAASSSITSSPPPADAQSPNLDRETFRMYAASRKPRDRLPSTMITKLQGLVQEDALHADVSKEDALFMQKAELNARFNLFDVFTKQMFVKLYRMVCGDQFVKLLKKDWAIILNTQHVRSVYHPTINDQLLCRVTSYVQKFTTAAFGTSEPTPDDLANAEDVD